jgi:phosphoglycolate phosphatase-like HAD superfamily hydrolase
MGVDIRKIKALLFDVDGTLRDTDDQWVERLSGMLHPIERLFPQRDTRRAARRMVMAVDDPANMALHVTDQLGIDNLVWWMVRRRRQRTVQPRQPVDPPGMIPGVREMLLRVQERYPLAVVSARDEPTTMRFLDGHRLTSLFREIVTGQTCRFTKPFPDPVQHAARQLGVASEECLMIGDTIVDIMAGKSAGAQTMGVLCGFGAEAELRRTGANEILPTTALLADFLLEKYAN